MYAITLYNIYVGRAVAVMLGVILVSVLLYGALLLGAVSHAAGRTAAEQSVRTLSAQVSELESQYLAATQDLSPERAAAMGFVAPVAVVTVFAAAPTLTLAGQAASGSR
jgi:hypothetical protein